MRIQSATATYTGGGIYIFVGSFDDGTHFMFSSEDDSILHTNEYPDLDNDDIWYEEWQTSHMIEYISNSRLYTDIIKWIINNHPGGNYQTSDLEYILSCEETR